MSRPSELTTDNTVKVVALVLENNQGEVLLTQRQAGKHLAGFWEFPGGKVDANETLQAALIREIREELDYFPKQFNKLITINHQYPEKKVELHFYQCIDGNAKPKPMEQQSMQWVHKSKLSNIKLPDANLKVLDLL